MSLTESTDHQPRPQPQDGKLTRLLKRWFLRPGRVSFIHTFSRHFRLIELEGDALKTAAWIPGQQIQLGIGAGMTNRTYTPISWNVQDGTTRILVYLHGDAPGSRWMRALRPQQAFDFLGPRHSIDLSDIPEPCVLFGDETCFGLAKALQDTLGGRRTRFIFEVSDLAESRLVLQIVELGDAVLIERTAGDAHLADIESHLRPLASDGAQYILAGKATSIQRARQALKAKGVASSRIRAKAYWAPGKSGLD
ncbi:siderophore-interacting protein [Bradyrhizobium ivorense]|uniref:siderophore-interacting protein n=1 Tax=Bradyrhizobium ivorense TaxID=2511166 RepID=UPI0010BA9735|nr:siderophore-interacting protein [Bradyrhizobium ivorense]VIO78560.1 hypothetical protein CI41S_64010 [Bradyrhizobium ivorense]